MQASSVRWEKAQPMCEVQGDQFTVIYDSVPNVHFPLTQVAGWVAPEVRWIRNPGDQQMRDPLVQHLTPHVAPDLKSAVLSLCTLPFDGGVIVGYIDNQRLSWKAVMPDSIWDIGSHQVVGLSDYFSQEVSPPLLASRARVLSQIYAVALNDQPLQLLFTKRDVTITLHASPTLSHQVHPLTTVGQYRLMRPELTGQPLTCNGYPLEDPYLLVEYGIEDGGQVDEPVKEDPRKGLGLLQFAQLERPILQDFDPAAPIWFRVAAGLNLKGTCRTLGCDAFGQEVWGQVGFEPVHNVNKWVCQAPCSGCTKFLENVSTCAFFQCSYDIKGKVQGRAEDEHYTGEIFGNRLHTFSPQDPVNWIWLEITVRPREG